MSKQTLFTSESVSEGHPDKMADQISDAILDAILAEDKHARVACETLINTGMIILAGEIKTTANFDYEKLARDTVKQIGYNSSEMGFDWETCALLNGLGKQSPDIAQGVDRAKPEDQGAGDQGLMFGYATNETDVLMPAPITYAHRLVKRQSEVRNNGTLPWLRPDAKSQISMRYEGGELTVQWTQEGTADRLRVAVGTDVRIINEVGGEATLPAAPDEQLVVVAERADGDAAVLSRDRVETFQEDDSFFGLF